MSRHAVRTLTALFALALCASPALAQKRPVQVSLLTPVQIFPPEDTITGVRLNLIYGKNETVIGLDVGIANHTTGLSRGLQYGIVGIAGDFQGWQAGVVSISKGKFEGFQEGLVNVSETFRGFQYGGVNHAQDAEGLQLAIVNYAQTLKGLQIGLINIIGEGGMFPVFPIFNVGKKE